MRTFAGKAAASADKSAAAITRPRRSPASWPRWVRQAGPRILEPSCGDGAILRELAALSDRGPRRGT